MGFGFNLFFAFIVLPATLILAIIWLVTRKKKFGQLLVFIWVPILGLVIGIAFLSIVVRFFTEKKELDWNDIYGQYVIDRTKFPGKQADWQYDHFRFDITRQNKFIFYVTEKEKIVKAYTGTVKFLYAYKRPRIILNVDAPKHHIIEDKPTLYREIFSFYYVFHSPKFGNVFFTKGHWKPVGK